MQFNKDIKTLCRAQATTTEAIKDIGKQIEQLVRQHDKDICTVTNEHNEDIQGLIKVMEANEKRLVCIETEFARLKSGYQALNFIKSIVGGIIGAIVGAMGFILLMYEVGSKLGGVK